MKNKNKTCLYKLVLKGSVAEATCGFTFNPYPYSAKNELDHTYTGTENAMLFCPHCGGKIKVGKKIEEGFGR